MAENLSSFRIRDLKRQPATSKARTEAPAEGSLGYPAIEAQLEQSDMETLIESLRASYSLLESQSQTGDMKTRSQAKRAMAAYERTADLFEYLFQTKAALQAELE